MLWELYRYSNRYYVNNYVTDNYRITFVLKFNKQTKLFKIQSIFVAITKRVLLFRTILVHNPCNLTLLVNKKKRKKTEKSQWTSNISSNVRRYVSTNDEEQRIILKRPVSVSGWNGRKHIRQTTDISLDGRKGCITRARNSKEGGHRSIKTAGSM